MNGLINPLVLCAVLLGAMNASGQPTTTAPSTASRDSNVTSFTKKFNPLRSKILDEDAQFSGSQMLTDLIALEPLATSVGAQSAELTNLYSMLSLLQFKRSLTEPAARYGELALKTNATSKALPIEEVVRTHNRLRKIYEDDDDFKRALPHAQSAVALSASDTSLTATQRLSLRESLGYLQHEAGQYALALETNRATLLDAEKVYAIDAIELAPVLTNIAQNLHASKNPVSAKPYLERVLKIARKHNDIQREFNMHFQLGVLAYEDRNEALAKRHFEDCMRVANNANDDDMRESARGYLKQLPEKKHPQRKQ